MNLFIIAGVIGPEQLLVIVVVILIFFGGSKIPELMKGLGQGMKEFKKASRGDFDEPAEKEKNEIK